MVMNPKFKPTRFISELHLPAALSPQAQVCNPPKDVSPEVTFLKETNAKVNSSELVKSIEQLYNKKNVNLVSSNKVIHRIKDHSHQQGSRLALQFSVSETERRYYKVLCWLAHSRWSSWEGAKLLKTSVTYCSLGESIEPSGHVDNFFIAGYCRKLFDDSHPKKSRKHYFYPRIGGCLLSYKSVHEANIVKNSFLGANSALKLHLADKLCFPVFDANHWFVFIVDLKSKLFFFLDSMFDENDNFQIRARNNLVPTFKQCWYEHAEVNFDLDDFSVVYPPVPKQNNCDDCGIFALMFLEYWDNTIDLRHVFGQSDIPNIRIKIGNALYFCKENAVDKSLVQNLFDQGIDGQVSE